MYDLEETQQSEIPLVFTGKHGLDFSAMNNLKFSHNNVKLLMKEFEKYKDKLDIFLNRNINSSTQHISNQYIPLTSLLSEAFQNQEGFNKYRIALIKLIQDIELFIIENSSKVTETINSGKESLDNII